MIEKREKKKEKKKKEKKRRRFMATSLELSGYVSINYIELVCMWLCFVESYFSTETHV